MSLRSVSMKVATANGNAKAANSLDAVLRDCRAALIAIGGFSCVINILMLTGPLFMLQMYDRVLASGSIPTLIALTILMAAMYGFVFLFEVVRARILVRIGVRLDARLTGKTFDFWVKQGLLRTGKDTARPLSDVEILRQFLSSGTPGTMFDVPWVPFYLALVFLLHWTLGLVALAGGMIVLLLGVVNELATRGQLKKALLQNIRSETIADQANRNAEAITAMGMLDSLWLRWRSTHEKGVAFSLSSSDRAATLSSGSKTFRLFLQSAILAAGAALAVHQIITPGVMIAASILTGRALAPVDQLIGQWKGVITARQAHRRLRGLFDAALPEVALTRLPAPRGRLQVRDIAVSPPGADKPVLKGLNFALEPGEALGVIGPSGSGKSTLAKLLVGAWHPLYGSVRLDGATLDQWDSRSLGRHLGYLPQEVELFDGTIKENIARFSPEAKDEDVVQAAQSAGVHELILGLEKGYETEVGRNGTRLSGGHKQRVALARALYLDPALVVLDEPNSNLDAAGDSSLAAAIKGLRERGRTVVVMAHRPSAIAEVNRLLVLREGAQVAFGDKETVIPQVTRPVPVPQANLQEVPVG